MSQEHRISRSALHVAAICALAVPGCAATMVPSQRLHEPEFAKVVGGPVQLGGHRFGMHVSPECTSCENRQRLQDYAHHAMPYVAGPFMHGPVESDFAVEQATIQPPHSKFHPVPTRPVFETRAAYLPPQPMGVELVPVPDQEWHSMEENDFDDADAFILSPPSN